jgi:citrate synthase
MWKPGLAGVVAARTAISRVDGIVGRLWYRGRRIEEVARETFEDAASLVLDAPLEPLGPARMAAWEVLRRIPACAPNPMDAVRARIAGVPDDTSTALIGAMAVAVALAVRPDAVPDPAAPHVADLFRMLTDRLPTAHEERALTAYLTTVMDHGLNASTFTARVVTSTGSDGVSAVTAAVGALAGPLHGGAPGPVLDMLDAVEDPSRARDWVDAELASGRRIMGMGHRVYRARDPRATVLEQAAGPLSSDRLPIARAVEHAAEVALAARHPDRPLRANVEFHTAILLDALGMDRTWFTPLFAAGRVVGWCAHIAEERAVGRIVRPSAEWVGAPCA